MHASRYVLAGAALCGAASAIPGATIVKRANPTDVWVTVDGNGSPSTVTPVATTVDGTPTIISGAPNDLTATVFTLASYGEVSTSTGTTPLATATAASGAGSFARCFNNHQDGSNGAPFCTPERNDTLYAGSTYYITWDPDFFNSTNATSNNVEIRVQGFKLNATTGAIAGDAVDLTTSNIRANLGFFAWNVDNSIMDGQPGMNVTLHLLYSPVVGGTTKELNGPTVLVTPVPVYHQAPARLPSGKALYIGLPVVLGVVIICLIGGCIWNRNKRKIGLGNVMSRSRHGYGVGKSRAQRMAGRVRRSMRRHKDGGIQLEDRDVVSPQEEYHDVPDRKPEGLPRRDSEALGVDDMFRTQGVSGGRNVFREEMMRQDRERY